MSLEKKCMKVRNIMEQRCDKRKNLSSAKENSKTRKCSPLSSVATKEVQANSKEQIIKSRNCHIFVINIDKTVCLYVSTSI